MGMVVVRESLVDGMLPKGFTGEISDFKIGNFK